MHIALEHLWGKYRAAFEAGETEHVRGLGKILDRGMVWAENEVGRTEILITGFNPSFRLGDTAGSFKFNYRDVVNILTAAECVLLDVLCEIAYMKLA